MFPDQRRLKRRNPELPPRDREDLKKTKKLGSTPTTDYLFVIEKEHSRFISAGNFNPFMVQDLHQTDLVKVKVVPRGSPVLRRDSEVVLRKFLDDFFKTTSSDQMEIKEVQDEKKELGNQIEMTDEQKKDLKENLIYQLHEKKIRVKKIAETFGIKPQDVYNIYYKKEKEINQPKTERKPKRFLITQEMYDELEEYMSKKKYTFLTLNIIRKHLIERFNLENWRISLKTVSNMLKRLSFSRKRTRKFSDRRNIDSTIKERKNVAIAFASAVKWDTEIIFIDETGFNQALTPLYGYAKIGEKCWIKTTGQGDNYSVLAAITKSKVLGFQIFKGSTTAEDFGAFFASLLNNNQDILNHPSKYLFFMDNASIHRANSLKSIFSNFCVLFNAPYSPFLNPIEELFGTWKYNFRKKFAQNTVDILQKILRSLQEVDNSLLYSFYIHSMTYLKDCLDGKAIL